MDAADTSANGRRTPMHNTVEIVKKRHRRDTEELEMGSYIHHERRLPHHNI